MSDDQAVTSSSRRRREKTSSSGRFAALAKLKQLKGSKNKYEVSDLENVYEEVDEREYSKRVRERQEDDWIVDDDGVGYVEDGREIFDDDLDDESIIIASRKKKRGGDHRGSKRVCLGTSKDQEKSNNIRSMLANMPAKKEAPVSLEEDDILGGIMQEISGDSTPLTKENAEIDTRLECSEESAVKYLKKFTEKEEHNVPEDSYDTTFHEEDITDISQQLDNADCEALHKNPQLNHNVAEVTSEEKFIIDAPKNKENIPANDINVLSSKPLTTENITVDINNLPFVKSAEGNQMMRFFWLDAHEEPLKQPGVIFLFGKVWIESAKEYVSCCVAVRNVERKILVLPREKMTVDSIEKDVTFLDVYKEFSNVASKYGIMEFRSRKVELNNCFNPEIPVTSEYMEVKYSMSVEKMEMVSVATSAQKLSPPPVVLLALQIRSVVNSKNNNNEVGLVVGLVNRDFPLNHEPPANKQYSQHFCILAPLCDQPFPYDIRECIKQQDGVYVERMDSERALLNNLLAKVQRLDPDFIVGHDILGFDLEVLLQRLLNHKIPNWSRLGRLRRHFPNPNDKVLEKETHPAVTFEEVRKCYESGSKLKNLINQTLFDTACALQIMCQISAIPISLQITNIAGNVLSRTLMGGRAERNEYLLLHAFHEKKFIPPEKTYKKAIVKNSEEEEADKRGKGRKKPNYSGGLVLEPKKGLYDKMVLMIPDVPSKDLEIGILPAEIRKLVESRAAVRKLMGDPKLSAVERAQLMANSTYGCLGFSNARFYAKPLAALITAKGREILMKTKEYVETMNYEVIYGDTDSIMINTNCADYEEVTKIGKQILQSVNKLYRCVNLDIDGVYKFMLLLKKKKYAVTEVIRLSDGTLKTKIKHKGLDIVRRDWSRIAIESGNFVVEQLLSDLPLEDRLVLIENHLRKLGEDLKAGCVPLPLLTVSKQLSRSLEQYTDDKSQPHVLVAKRLLKKGMCRMKAGDTVSYVICDDGTTGTAVQRAYHLDELKMDKNLKIDYKYYLAHQIHPVITRLLDPVDGIDSCRIAEFLGLDPTPYKQSLRQQAAKSEDNTEKPFALLLREPEHYEKCEKFSFTCVQCKTETVMEKPFKKDDAGNLYPSLSRCANSQCTVRPTQYLASLENRLTSMLRYHLHQYYKGVLICEDPACPLRTRFVPLNFHRAYPVCILCDSAVMYKEVSDKDLYTQLLFFQRIFDLHGSPDYKNGFQVSAEVETAYIKLYNKVENFLKYSFYSRVDCTSLFKNCTGKLALSIKKALHSGVSASALQQLC
ncbi:DNA polymerase alpha catalytic subunit [Gryllus bimaculatus]|nr:DNA polymerase alpha catalytic subunit [Gryllus bimaculatus]